MGEAKGTETQAHDLSRRPEENCSRSTREVGEGPCEESGLATLDSGR